MKNPNGFGSVYKLSDKRRRRPWAVRVTESWDISDGKLKRKYKYLGYYATRKEAMQALSEYNVNPEKSTSDITFAELFKTWSEERLDSFSLSTSRAYRSAFKKCSSIYGMSFKDLRRPHLQKIIDDNSSSYQGIAHIKSMLTHLYKYAIENDICDKNYAQFTDTAKYAKKDRENKTPMHRVFTDDEINILWERSAEYEPAQIVLILIYTGLRISELLNLKKCDIHLDEKRFHVSKSKTAAGIRDVPIADKVLPFFESRMESDGDYLIDNSGKGYSYSGFVDRFWNPYRAVFNTDHTPHDTRHTCVSRLAERKVDQTIIKKIVGHTGAMTVTEKVYTHFDMKPLLEAINLI